MIQQFAAFKRKEKKNEKEPDYTLSAKFGDEYKEIGAAWIKQSNNGAFLSISLKKPYKDKEGFYLESYKEGEATDAL